MAEWKETMKEDRKGLERKNQLYSMTLAVILLGCLIGYFICMLPSLYVSYRKEQNLNSVEQQHRAYMETGSYDGIKLVNPTACFSVRIPDEGDTIFITGQAWKMEVTAAAPYAKSAFDSLRQYLHRYREGDFKEDNHKEAFAEEMEEWLSVWKEHSISLPVQIDFQLTGSMEYSEDGVKLHLISDEMLIIEAGASDGENIYTNYIAMEDAGDALVFTCLAAMTPDMGEIRPVVMQSIPMLAAVVLLLVLLFSAVYSKGILAPMYHELEKKNQALQEENERQEIFMRASSHQLKTPLSAALLLLDGMINRVGKYQDTAVYLPKAKEQLLSMRKMVEDILSLNHCRDDIGLHDIQVMPLLENRLSQYRVAAADKGLQVSCSGIDTIIKADENLLQQILDNLIANAVAYTPEGGSIELRVSTGKITIENYGVTISKDILPHVFEPFVSGNHEREIAGHGLGLYIAAYYAKQMGFSLQIENGTDSVLAVLYFS